MDILFGETSFASLHLKNHQKFKGGTRPLACKNRTVKQKKYRVRIVNPVISIYTKIMDNTIIQNQITEKIFAKLPKSELAEYQTSEQI